MKTLLESKSLQQEFLAAEDALWSVKGYFVDRLRKSLNLTRVTAPMLVEAGTGINDDLNGIERPLGFSTKALEGRRVEVVQSLAKWKRLKLADAGIEPGRGIVTDMRAIRPDEVLSHIHSLYVDQWDWEMVMEPQQRNLEFLQLIVTRLYVAIRDTEHYVSTLYPEIRPILPTSIKFIHAEDLQAQFPYLSPRERETEATKEHEVFSEVLGIDISEKLVAEANNNAQQEKLANLRYEVKDVGRLKLEPNSADVVLFHDSYGYCCLKNLANL